MKLTCPNNCKTEADTPFYYPPSACGLTEEDEPELGVLAYPDGSPSNRWQDGTAGVSDGIIVTLLAGDDLPHCIECHEEAIPDHGTEP